MTKQVNFTLPVFEEIVNKVPCKVDPEKWTDDQAQTMLAGAYLQGLRIILQRATSGTDTPEQARKAIADKAKELTLGAYEFGAGGGGARLSPEEVGWISYLASIKHLEDKKLVNGKTLRRAQETLCRRDLIAREDPGTEARKDVETNIARHIKERFDKWLAWFETETVSLATAIQEERDRPAKEAAARAETMAHAAKLKASDF